MVCSGGSEETVVAETKECREELGGQDYVYSQVQEFRLDLKAAQDYERL